MTVVEACELINRYRGSTVTLTLSANQITSGQPDLLGRLRTNGRVVEARSTSPHLFELSLAGVTDLQRLVLRIRNRELVWYPDGQRLVISETTGSKVVVAAELVFGAQGGGTSEFGLTVSN